MILTMKRKNTYSSNLLCKIVSFTSLMNINTSRNGFRKLLSRDFLSKQNDNFSSGFRWPSVNWWDLKCPFLNEGWGRVNQISMDMQDYNSESNELRGLFIEQWFGLKLRYNETTMVKERWKSFDVNWKKLAAKINNPKIIKLFL